MLLSDIEPLKTVYIGMRSSKFEYREKEQVSDIKYNRKKHSIIGNKTSRAVRGGEKKPWEKKE